MGDNCKVTLIAIALEAKRRWSFDQDSTTVVICRVQQCSASRTTLYGEVSSGGIALNKEDGPAASVCLSHGKAFYNALRRLAR